MAATRAELSSEIRCGISQTFVEVEVEVGVEVEVEVKARQELLTASVTFASLPSPS